MAALARSTQYAHFTPEFMVRAAWRAVTAMGFGGGRVLEPGCGTGLFLALMPEPVAATTAVTAIEMDPSTARIAKLLYPEAWVRLARPDRRSALPNSAMSFRAASMRAGSVRISASFLRVGEFAEVEVVAHPSIEIESAVIVSRKIRRSSSKGDEQYGWVKWGMEI
jgi:SAM-dependent methyltransferase